MAGTVKVDSRYSSMLTLSWCLVKLLTWAHQVGDWVFQHFDEVDAEQFQSGVGIEFLSSWWWFISHIFQAFCCCPDLFGQFCDSMRLDEVAEWTLIEMNDGFISNGNFCCWRRRCGCQKSGEKRRRRRKKTWFNLSSFERRRCCCCCCCWYFFLFCFFHAAYSFKCHIWVDVDPVNCEPTSIKYDRIWFPK